MRILPNNNFSVDDGWCFHTTRCFGGRNEGEVEGIGKISDCEYGAGFLSGG